MISMIWSMDSNRLIGCENRLPWRLPADLAYFKKTTLGHKIVMGRKTFESIGRPLPGRENIILTRDKSYTAEGCAVCHSIDDVVKISKDIEVFIIGGAEVYSKFLPCADRLYITMIDGSFEGDAYFPEFDLGNWKLVSKNKGEKDEKNPYDFWFGVYDRV